MKVIICTNDINGLYNFRVELVKELLIKKIDVVISSPLGDRVDFFCNLGCSHINTNIDRRGMNPLKDFQLYKHYKKIIRYERPNAVLTYTIKPNIYAGLASKKLKIPYLCNITGLGSLFQSNFKRKIAVFLYKRAMKNVDTIFFQNIENKRIFLENKIVSEGKIILLNGSGVNLQKFNQQKYENLMCDKILFIGRIMRDKGIDELLHVAKKCHDENLKIEFSLLGSFDGDYLDIIDYYQENGIIKYLNYEIDIINIVNNHNCVILPSYHEGMSNALLEGAAMGRPLITTNINGCKEIVIDGVTGFLAKVKCADSLYEKVIQFHRLSFDEKYAMGCAGRKHIEDNFDRREITKKIIGRIDEVIRNEFI